MAYKDISRGVRLKADHDKYLTWLNKDTEARQSAYATVTVAADKVKTTRVLGYIVPFTSTGTPLTYLPARLIGATQTGRGSALALAIRGILDPFNFEEQELKALASANIIEGSNFKPAKLTIIQRVKTAEKKSSSRITGRQYYKHENDSITGRFGKKIAADTYDTTITAIKANATFAGLFTGNETELASKYRFVPEGV
jgi:hypothetical protein